MLYIIVMSNFGYCGKGRDYGCDEGGSPLTGLVIYIIHVNEPDKKGVADG